MIGNDYNEGIPFELLLSPSLKPYQLKLIKVIYSAGYVSKSNENNDEQLPKRNNPLAVPEDLAAACMENQN